MEARLSDIPTPTLKRLPMYYRELMRAMQVGKHKISSTELGILLEIPSTQVRKDLGYLADQGRPGVGYDVKRLAATLEHFLALSQPKKAALAGVGNLANALIHFPGFQQYGLHLTMLFDNDPAKIGNQIAGLTIHAISDLADMLMANKIPIGIITTPTEAAQQVTDLMVAGGVQSIWNFAPITLKVPESIFVVNQDLSVELAILSYRTAQNNPSH
jgi:redox-sensing transcriptional repressor